MDGFAFVQLVEAELKKRKMSKEEFYAGSGVSSATFSQWRKRIYSPSSVAIKKIEEFLNISFAIEQKENKPTPEGELTETQREAVELIKKMSDEQLKIFVAMLKATMGG